MKPKAVAFSLRIANRYPNVVDIEKTNEKKKAYRFQLTLLIECMNDTNLQPENKEMKTSLSMTCRREAHKH